MRGIILLILLITTSALGEIKNKGSVRLFLNKVNLVQFHSLVVQQALEKLDYDEISKDKKEKFLEFVKKNYSIEKVIPYLVDEMSFSYSNKELKRLNTIFDNPFFSKMMNVLFGIYQNYEKEAKELKDYFKNKADYNQYRVKYTTSIVKNSKLDHSQTMLSSMMGRLFYIEFNDYLKMSGLSKLELKLVFRNMDAKERTAAQDKITKLFYYKTRKALLSEIVEFSRLMQDRTYVKFMRTINQVLELYYDNYLEEKGINQVEVNY